MKYFILSSLLFFMLLPYNIYSQAVKYKSYKNERYLFSFSIPKNWQIKALDQKTYNCFTTNAIERKQYNRCFDGIIFTMEVFNGSLDAVLMDNGSYFKIDSLYYTSDRVNDSVSVKQIAGKGWIGAYHENVCGIECKGTGFHPAGGSCDFIYFSNDHITVSIYTNGRAFDEKVLNGILKSFQFKKHIKKTF